MDTIHKDYKEIFFGNLERNIVKELRPEVALQSEDELGNEVKEQTEEQVIQWEQAQAKTVRVKVFKSLSR
ncbi:Hypothetical protein BCD_1615 (plasmid) [Borrelia crocidurae DOU]|uniref:Uncharacterized protein n=1 Tax=Borrelia crocidurae DOU TaxID=1293575 RepID=W5SRI1_9SPIR|nr:hypothetical protein [Borrelia crocidurae]AHH07681.1 Hypothetical protein BCD_1615 [Borrelia crocidurae DOU]